MRKTKRGRVALVGALALALCATGVMTAGDVAFAAKKKKAGGTANVTKQVNQAIPDATPPVPTWGRLVSTISIGGKKFKGTRIRDVNVTIQTSGAGPNASRDLAFTLTAPNGTNDWFFAFPGNSTNVGPLTLDDESVNSIQADYGGAIAGPRDSTWLAAPFAGTAQPFCFQANGACPLAALDNGPASGTWTLTAFDGGTNAGNTSVLNSWGLVVQAGKPYQTK